MLKTQNLQGYKLIEHDECLLIFPIFKKKMLHLKPINENLNI